MLAHGGGERELPGFAGGDEALVEHADHRIVAAGDQRCHVEHAAHHGTAPVDAALAAPRGILRDRREPAERRSPCRRSGRLGQQRQRELVATGPTPGTGCQDRRPPGGLRLGRKRRGDVLVERRQLGLQRGEMGAQRVPVFPAPPRRSRLPSALTSCASWRQRSTRACRRACATLGGRCAAAEPARRSVRAAGHRAGRSWPASRGPWPRTAGCGAG